MQSAEDRPRRVCAAARVRLAIVHLVSRGMIPFPGSIARDMGRTAMRSREM